MIIYYIAYSCRISFTSSQQHCMRLDLSSSKGNSTVLKAEMLSELLYPNLLVQVYWQNFITLDILNAFLFKHLPLAYNDNPLVLARVNQKSKQ